jgi:hypothetical protein
MVPCQNPLGRRSWSSASSASTTVAVRASFARLTALSWNIPPERIRFARWVGGKLFIVATGLRRLRAIGVSSR